MGDPVIRRRNYGGGHGYVDDQGRRVLSVTKALEAVAKPALIGWSARVTVDYAINHWDELSQMDVADRLRVLDKAHILARNSARNTGSKFHVIVDKLSRGERVEYDAKLEPYVQSALAFLHDFDAIPRYVEAPVWLETLGGAGTFDWIGELATGEGEDPYEWWLIDWKRANGVYAENALQLGAYRSAEWLLQPDGSAIAMPEVDRTGVVQITEEGYELVEVYTAPVDLGDRTVQAVDYFAHAQHLADFAEIGRHFIGEPVEPPIWEAPEDTEETPF